MFEKHDQSDGMDRIRQVTMGCNMVAEGVDCVIRVGYLPDSELVCKKLGEIEVINCNSPIYLMTAVPEPKA